MDTTSPLLESFSKISLQTRCNNCHVTLDQVRWQHCPKCHNYDLCDSCVKDSTIAAHMNTCMGSDSDQERDKDNHYVWAEDVEKCSGPYLDETKEKWFKYIIRTGKIENDYQMFYVMAMLQKDGDKLPDDNQVSDVMEKLKDCDDKVLDHFKLGHALAKYYTQASQRNICVLSLDGGGVRGYMSIKVLEQLIKNEYFSDIEPPNLEDEKDPKTIKYHEDFKNAQQKFTENFDYFVGTSTGGLLAFCLATDYPLSKIKSIYACPERFFIRNWFTTKWALGLGNVMWATYNHQPIHAEIEKVINNVFEKFYGNKDLTAANATLLDLHNLLNKKCIYKNNTKEDHRSHGNMAEFVEAKPQEKKEVGNSWTNPVIREKVLLINAYNTTKSLMTVFNTSYAEHWGYRIADVLKATMAAPTYFQPWHMCKWEKKDGNFDKEKDVDGNYVKEHVFIDGGVFANDPELTALWAIRMQWKKLVNYRLFSIGTGCYNPEVDTDSWGGLYTWMLKRGKAGLVISTLMDATRSLTETIMTNLAKFDNIKRIKFNYKLKQSLELDDTEFPKKFDKEWDIPIKELQNKSKDEAKGESKDGSRYGLKYGPDYGAFVYFYKKHIEKPTN